MGVTAKQYPSAWAAAAAATAAATEVSGRIRYTVNIQTYNPDWRAVHDAYGSDDEDWGGDSIAFRDVSIESAEFNQYFERLRTDREREQILKSVNQWPSGKLTLGPWFKHCVLKFENKAMMANALSRWFAASSDDQPDMVDGTSTR